jgi:AraC-like DNA-binding protein
VETTSLEATLRILAAVRGAVRVRSCGPRLGMRMVRDTLGPLRFDQMRYAMAFVAEAGPLGALYFCHVSAGTIAFHSDGQERRYRAGGVCLIAQPEHGSTAMVRCDAHELAIIDPGMLSQVASAIPGTGPVRFTGYDAISAAAAGRYQRTSIWLRDQVLANPEARAQPLVTSAAARLLIATLLATFPSTALTDPTAADRRDASAGTVHRAVTFIDEHAQDDISTADIATAAQVSIRTVQLAFRRHLGLTPLGYLRRVRLEHAHRALLAAAPAPGAVTAVAYQWGFASPGWFAASYRAAYGVPPSHTLRRG